MFLAIVLYTILHECGHGLFAILCGARIANFTILGAHMSCEGGIFGAVTFSLHHAAGMLLPLFVSFVYMIRYSKTRDNIFYRIFFFFFSLLLFFALRAWHLSRCSLWRARPRQAVIAGEKAGSKLTKAQELGVPVLTDQEFLAMLDESVN